jgi:hypothetical protein
LVLQAGVNGQNYIMAMLNLLGYNSRCWNSDSVNASLKSLLSVGTCQARVVLSLNASKGNSLNVNKSQQIAGYRSVWIKPALV